MISPGTEEEKRRSSQKEGQKERSCSEKKKKNGTRKLKEHTVFLFNGTPRKK